MQDHRTVSDVVKIVQSDKVKAQFTIEWNDGKSEKFEADNQQVARTRCRASSPILSQNCSHTVIAGEIVTLIESLKAKSQS